jgi:hypothetical protein
MAYSHGMEQMEKSDRVLMPLVFCLAAFLVMILYDLLDYLSFQGMLPFTVSPTALTVIGLTTRVIALTGLSIVLIRICAMKKAAVFFTTLSPALVYAVVSVTISTSVHGAEIRQQLLDAFQKYQGQLGGSAESMVERMKPIISISSYVVSILVGAIITGISFGIALLINLALGAGPKKAESESPQS